VFHADVLVGDLGALRICSSKAEGWLRVKCSVELDWIGLDNRKGSDG
jgi:hypothetical protein